MAHNLRTKIPSSDTMTIHDVNPSICEQFAKEHSGVKIAESYREIAENSVGLINTLQAPGTKPT